MHRVSTSPKRISPEEVSKDNSDIWRYSPDLYSALRKEKFSKSNPEAHMNYMEAIGELGLVSPYNDLELQMDLEKFKEGLSESDLEIFNLMLLGMKQREIKEIVGLCQATVSKRLRNLKAKFKEFYLDGE
jgi:DNA-binding NarL/FixJ family response regulator